MLDALHARILHEAPVPADAIVWLQGNGYDRGTRVIELFRQGYAPRIVITGNRTRSSITVDHLTAWLVDRGAPADAVMVDASSFHTRDQAVRVLDLAMEHAWRTVLLVGSPHHQLRAFFTLCKRAEEIAWGGRIVNQPATMRWDDVPSEREHSMRHLFAREVEKLAAYASHIASMEIVRAHLDHMTPHPSAPRAPQ